MFTTKRSRDKNVQISKFKQDSVIQERAINSDANPESSSLPFLAKARSCQACVQTCEQLFQWEIWNEQL